MKEILFDKTHRGRALIKVLGITAITLFMLVSTAGASTFAYITNQGSNTVSVIDLVTNTVTATVNVGIRPSGVEFIPEGNVYIANTGSNNVSVIDSSTNTVIATVNVGSSPNGVAASTDRTKVYVTNYGSNTVSVIDTVANIVTATVTVGNHPFGVAVAGTKAYVTNDIDRTVSVIDTTTDTVTATISMGNKYPGGIAATETNVYVTSGANDTLSVIDTATDTVIATVPVGDKPTGIAVMGSSIYVANSGSNNISIINTGLWQTTTVSVGKSPYGVAVTPNGAEVYIANSRSNTVSVINTTTNTITATVNVGNLPKALGQFTGRQTPEIDSSKIHVTRITTSGSASDPHIYGDKVVYQDNRNGNADIYIYDLSTKNEIHTNNLSDQVNPAIYENNVVWEDYRNGGSDIYLQNLSTKIQTRITTSRMASGPEIYGNRIPYVKYAYNGRENWHELYMYDLSTKRETQIPTMISSYQPSIYGNRIVWTDHDGFNGGDYFIYMYDVSTKTQTQIARSDDWWRTGEVVDMPDIYGNRIVWQDSRNWDAIWDIYMYDLSTKREVQISNSGTANCPAIYNNRIVWEDSFDGQNIHMYDISSSREVRITTSGSAHSPDIYGNRIVWVDGNDIYVGTLNYPVYPVADFSSNVTEGYVPLTVQFTDLSENATEWNWDFGDGATSIEQNPVHTYSTAGTYTVNLTVSNSNGKDSKLVTIKVFTQEAGITKIASYVREWADPVWSPSGNEILFAKDDGLYKVFPDGSGEKQLVSGLISEYAWSPDGNKISYSEPEGIDEYGNRLDGERICVINADGTGKTQLLSVSGEGHYLLHNWFPSGSKILYAKCHTYSPDVDVPPEMDSTQYGIINSDGSNNQELGEIGGALSSVSLSPDASKVAHSSWGTGVRDLNQNSQDYFYLDNSYIASQTQSWQPQVWSPDSSKIAYWSYESGSSDIYTIKSDGTEKTQLTSEPGNENSPIFSPDGSKIIYVSDETGNNDILVMDADGSNNVHLTADTAADVRPVWNPDGTKIAFCSDREGDYGIYILTLKAGSDSVTSLQSTSGSNWINWTWTNPSDPDFNHTEIYLNGTFQTSISVEHFNATGLQPETSYNISIRTVDIDGNVNPSWVNATMTTLETSTSAFPDAVEAEIYFSPSTLKLGGRGQLVTAYIELPEGYGAEGIDISSVLLNNAVSAVTDPKYNFVTDKNKYLTDIDQDGVLERMLKFDRKTVESILEAGNEVTVTFKGEVEYNNGTSSGMASFEGSDVIRVTDSKNKKG